jgi:glycosyltransferase involved in cell wall biosynthesis
VAEAVRSVLDQRPPPREIIVIDDGSTDDTASVLAVFGDAVRYVHQPQKGVSAARNCGIRMSAAPWIAFLDSDDWWLPGKLRIQMDYLQSRPEIKICQTEEIWIQNGKRRNPRKYHQKPNGYCFPRLLERCLVSPSAVVVHRTLLDEAGLFDESLPACEDYDLWLRIGCRYPVGLVPEPLVIKRGGHPDQLSATVPALDRFRIQALEKLLRTRPLAPEQRRQALVVLERKCRIYAQGCAKRGNREEGERILALPAALSPAHET